MVYFWIPTHNKRSYSELLLSGSDESESSGSEHKKQKCNRHTCASTLDSLSYSSDGYSTVEKNTNTAIWNPPLNPIKTLVENMLKIRAVFPRHPLFARYSKGINTVSTLFFESDLERKFPNMCSTHTYTENKHITPNLSFSGFMPKQTPLHLHRPYFGILTTTFPDQTHKKSIGVHTMNAQTGQLRPQESVRFETWQHDTCLSEIETVVSDTPQQATQFFDGSPIQKIEGVWDGQNTIGHFVGEVRITYDNGTTLEGNLDTGVSTPRIIGPATHTLTDGVKISGIMMLREDNSWGFDGPATVYYPNGTHRIGEFVLQSRGWHFVT